MATEGFAGADSLAAERSWIDRIWPARLSLETLIFAPPGTQATARVDVAAKSVTRELKLRRLARNLLKRNPPLPASTAVAAVAAAGAPRQSPVRETVGE